MPLCIAVLVLITGCASSSAEKNAPAVSAGPQAQVRGQLPANGTVLLRSGMTDMNENNPLFQGLASSLTPALAARGLTVASAPPSSIPASTQTAAHGASGYNAASGKLTLASYAVPKQDSDLPASVMAIRPVDAAAVLHARSQRQGAPVVYSGTTVPGRMPPEVAAVDPALADYTMVCRFASLSASGAGIVAAAPAPRPDTLQRPAFIVTAAGPIRGVGTLGYGNSAPSSPPRPPYGGGPTDFSKGREGPISGPPDFFGREADLRARDFQTKYGPQPQYATPPAAVSPGVSYPPGRLPSSPKPPLPGDNRMPDAPLPPASPGGVKPAPVEPGAAAPAYPPHGGAYGPAGATRIAAYALEMECYDLKPARSGQHPRVVWSAVVRQGATDPGLAAALPGMANLALAQTP